MGLQSGRLFVPGGVHRFSFGGEASFAFRHLFTCSFTEEAEKKLPQIGQSTWLACDIVNHTNSPTIWITYIFRPTAVACSVYQFIFFHQAVSRLPNLDDVMNAWETQNGGWLQIIRLGSMLNNFTNCSGSVCFLHFLGTLDSFSWFLDRIYAVVRPIFPCQGEVKDVNHVRCGWLFSHALYIYSFS